MADKSNDPVAMWQNMIGEMEKGFNSFANQAMSSPEFSKVMNQVGGATAGAQKQLGEWMEKYLVSMNLPSRAQMIGMAERLQSIEGPAQRDQGDADPDGQGVGRRGWRRVDVDAASHQASALGRGRAKMNAPAPAALDFASISDRVQSEVQRAIQRSIKGVEYFNSPAPRSARRRRTCWRAAARCSSITTGRWRTKSTACRS